MAIADHLPDWLTADDPPECEHEWETSFVYEAATKQNHGDRVTFTKHEYEACQKCHRYNIGPPIARASIYFDETESIDE